MSNGVTLQTLIESKKQQIYFIELNRDIHLGERTIKKGLDLPVDPDALRTMVKDGGESFDFKEILRDMCLVIGLDPQFPHIEHYRTLVGGFIDKPFNYCMGLGMQASAQGVWLDAQAFFKAALTFEAHFDGYFNLAKAFYAMAIAPEPVVGALKEAHANFDLARQIERRASVDYYLAFVLHLEEKHIEALAVAKQALEGDLEENLVQDLLQKMSVLEDRALYQQGVNLILDERFQEGLEALLSMSENAHDDWRVQFFIGLGYRGTMNLSLSMQHLLRAKALNPAEDRIYNELGVVAMMLEDFNAAKGFFTEGLKIKPLNSDILCNLAILYIEAKEWTLAQKFIDEAFAVSPDDAIVKQTMQYIQDYGPQKDVQH